MSMLRLTMIGNLGRDATVKEVSDAHVINFSVAHTEKFTSQGVEKEKTTWVSCHYWPKTTKVAEYLKKGTLVMVEGTPEVRTWETDEGKHGAELRLRVFNLQLLGGAKPTQAAEATAEVAGTTEAPTDDLPF